MATIQRRIAKSGDISYRAMVRLRGAPAQYATFSRKTDAKDWASRTEAAIKEGRYLPTNEARKHTLSELVARYKADLEASKPKAKRRDQERHLDWWSDALGEYSLSALTPGVIAETRDQLARGRTVRGGRRTPATVNRYLASLSHALNVARREWGWLVENPCSRVRKLKEPRGRVRFLSDQERDRLLSECRASEDSRLYPLVLLAIATGARRGELLRLRWPDIDWQRGVAVVHESKNKERRALPLSSSTLEAVRELAKVRRVDTDLLFATASRRAAFPRRAWQEALRAAKINDLRFHDLRHTAASYLAMSGATLAELAEILGHKTLAMVKRYSHLTEQHTSRVVERMNRRFLGGRR